MMGYYGNWGTMAGFGTLGIITWLVIVIDAVLLGIWLWKQINK